MFSLNCCMLLHPPPTHKKKERKKVTSLHFTGFQRMSHLTSIISPDTFQSWTLKFKEALPHKHHHPWHSPSSWTVLSAPYCLCTLHKPLCWLPDGLWLCTWHPLLRVSSAMHKQHQHTVCSWHQQGHVNLRWTRNYSCQFRVNLGFPAMFWNWNLIPLLHWSLVRWEDVLWVNCRSQ